MCVCDTRSGCSCFVVVAPCNRRPSKMLASVGSVPWGLARCPFGEAARRALRLLSLGSSRARWSAVIMRGLASAAARTVSRPRRCVRRWKGALHEAVEPAANAWDAHSLTPKANRANRCEAGQTNKKAPRQGTRRTSSSQHLAASKVAMWKSTVSAREIAASREGDV